MKQWERVLGFSKSERFVEFLRRLAAQPAAGSFDEAYELIWTVLNGVEDELMSVPFNPEHWMTDGRMYPPLMDNLRYVPGHPHVKRFRSLRHHTFIATNGAIEIRSVSGNVVEFTKPGGDGRHVWDDSDHDQDK